MPEKNNQNKKSTCYSTIETLISFLEGTGVGLLGRAAMWPSEWVYYQAAQKSNPLSYWTLYRVCLSPTMMRELTTSFIKAGVKPTVGKSFSNAGVYKMMDLKFAHLNDQPLKKAFIATLFSAPLEAYFTSPGEYEKIQRFHKTQNSYVLGKTERNRFRAATFTRILGTRFMTISGIYQMKAWMNPFFSPSTPDSVKNGITATIAGGLVQVANTPFINYHTFAALHLKMTFKESVIAFIKENTKVKDLERGLNGRGINCAGYYGLTFFVAKAIDESKVYNENKSACIEKLSNLAESVFNRLKNR